MGSPQRITTFWAYPSGITTASVRLGATAVKRRPRAALSLLAVVAAASVAACACWAPVPMTAVPAAVATVTTAAARIIERRLSAVAMTSPTYSLSLVFGISWKQALPQRYRQVMADLPPGCESDVPINGRSLRTFALPMRSLGFSVTLGGAYVRKQASGMNGGEPMGSAGVLGLRG